MKPAALPLHRSWSDPLVWSNFPLLLFANVWMVRGRIIQGLFLGLSGSLSILYHGSYERAWGEADEKWAYVALGWSLWELYNALCRKTRDIALLYVGVMVVDLGVAVGVFIVAKPLRASRVTTPAYSSWHTAWHWAVVFGQGLLLAASS